MQEYTIRSGDTFLKLSRDFGVSLDDLIDVNPHVQDPNQVAPGLQIFIPSWHTTVLNPQDKRVPEPGSALYRFGLHGHLMVATMGMPNPEHFNGFKVYTAWVMRRDDFLVHFNLLCVPKTGFWINHMDIPALKPGLTVAVTPEPIHHRHVPTGPVVLRGRLRPL